MRGRCGGPIPDLQIDLGHLEALITNTLIVRGDFEDAEQFSHTVADLVASQWNVRRGEVLEELDFITEATKSIHDTMVELDQELSTVFSNYRGNRISGGGGGGGGR